MTGSWTNRGDRPAGEAARRSLTVYLDWTAGGPTARRCPRCSLGARRRHRRLRGRGRQAGAVTTTDDAITPVIADGLRRAEAGGHQAYVVRLDTPGGLDVSMRSIIRDFLDARVLVVAYVSPSGARAASAER